MMMNSMLSISDSNILTMFGPMIILFLVFYLFLIRPQKKREKQTQAMRASLDVGDEVVTIGGIVGRVVSIKDETLVIETGTDRNKIRITRWAVNNITSEKELPKEAGEEK